MILNCRVVRSRFDLAFLRPLPPVGLFPKNRVYIPYNVQPISDQFWLAPRSLSLTMASAIESYYSCDENVEDIAMWWGTQEAGWSAETETLLLKHMRMKAVPFRLYDFGQLIVRTHEGPLCGSVSSHAGTFIVAALKVSVTFF